MNICRESNINLKLMMGIQDSNTKDGWVRPQPETELAHEKRGGRMNSPREKNR